jgi:hypothetical protein
MEVPIASNFNDFVALSAANSPHDLVMGSGRRLELALREYCGILGLKIDSRGRGATGKMEKAVSRDQALGPGVALRIRDLRQLRNRVAHEPIYVSCKDAIAYAQQAFSLIAMVGNRVSELEGR